MEFPKAIFVEYRKEKFGETFKLNLYTVSELVGIVGPSGSGKSTSVGNIPELGIKGLNPEETFVINVMGKPLPFRGWKSKYQEGKNYFSTIDPKMVLAAFAKIKDNPAIKNIVLDD